jgi:hypothetical protein
MPGSLPVVQSPNMRWVRLSTIAFNDALLSIANTVASITIDPFQVGMGNNVLIHETLVAERIQFAGNAGTLLLDVGKSGSTEIYAKDVALKSASGTRTLGSGTTSVKPRIIELNGIQVLLTFTSSSGNLSTLSAGAVDVYALVSNVPVLN